MSSAGVSSPIQQSLCWQSRPWICELSIDEGIGENVYEDAMSFRPERWFERPEMVKEPTAYSPFSTGMLILSISLLAQCQSCSFEGRIYESREIIKPPPQIGILIVRIAVFAHSLPSPLNLTNLLFRHIRLHWQVPRAHESSYHNREASDEIRHQLCAW